MAETAPRCADCKFFIPFAANHSGHCRRFPPSDVTRMVLPVVTMAHWCGEFKQAPKKPNK